MIRRWTWPRALIAFATVTGAGYAVWNYALRTPPATYTFTSVDISRGSIERSISATGSVQALVTVDVSSQLSGQLSDIKVDFNSAVKKGDTLAVIDPRTFAARVASGDANLKIAKTAVEIGEANIVKARSLRGQAERALERQKQLAATRSTPVASLDAAQTQYETSVADLEVADAQLANARATVAQREAELAQSKLDLDRTLIRTPIDGVVIARNVALGSTVAASLQAPILFQIAQDLTQIEILVLVDEADIGAIATGQPVTFTVDAYPDRVFAGEVAQVRIAGKTTNNVVTYTVVVRAQNAQQRLLPGMTATVRIVTGTRKDVLRVPNEAVRFTPPKDVRTTAPAERPNRDEAIVTSLSEKLKLSPEQTEKFRAGMAATRKREGGETAGTTERTSERGSERGSGRNAARSGATRGGAPSANDAERRGRVSRVLEGILNPEQMTAYKALRDDYRDQRRPANVWSESPAGLQPHRIQLGLADESFSEMLSTSLKEGDRVVTKAQANGSSERGRERRSRQ